MCLRHPAPQGARLHVKVKVKGFPPVSPGFPRVFPGYPWVFLGFSKGIPGVFPGFSLCFPGVFQGYSRGVPGVFPLFSGGIPGKNKATSLKKIKKINKKKKNSRNFFKLVSVLLSASVERVGVSRMQDFFVNFWIFEIF